MKPYYLYELNFPNGKKYLGISSNPVSRLKGHGYSANTGSLFPVHCAIRKYGLENVSQRILCVGLRGYIAKLEIEAIRLFETRNPTKGYNVSFGGDLSPMRSKEVRARVAATKKIVCNTPEFKEKISKIHTGRKASPETKEKLRIAHLGIGWSEEQRKKSVGRIPHNKGILATEEQKERCRIVALERHRLRRERGENIVVSEEQRKRISASLKGHLGAYKGQKRPAWVGAKISATKLKANGKK